MYNEKPAQPLHITNHVATTPNGCRVWWEPDTDASNPCEDWDMLWKIVGWDRNRNIGHQPQLAKDGYWWGNSTDYRRRVEIPARAFVSREEFNGWLLDKVWDDKLGRTRKDLMQDFDKRLVMVPLCMSDGGDLFSVNTIDTYPHSLNHRKQIGWLLAARAALFDVAPRSNQRHKRVVMDKVMRDWMFKGIDSQLRIYNQWVNVEMRGYHLTLPWETPGDGDEIVWGVYPQTTEKLTLKWVLDNYFYDLANRPVDELGALYGMMFVEGAWKSVQELEVGANNIQPGLWDAQ